MRRRTQQGEAAIYHLLDGASANHMPMKSFVPCNIDGLVLAQKRICCKSCACPRHILISIQDKTVKSLVLYKLFLFQIIQEYFLRSHTHQYLISAFHQITVLLKRGQILRYSCIKIYLIYYPAAASKHKQLSLLTKCHFAQSGLGIWQVNFNLPDSIVCMIDIQTIDIFHVLCVC